MKSLEKIRNRITKLESRCGHTNEASAATLSDDEIERRSREILVKNGHPEAQTASRATLLKLAEAELAAAGESP